MLFFFKLVKKWQGEKISKNIDIWENGPLKGIFKWQQSFIKIIHQCKGQIYIFICKKKSKNITNSIKLNLKKKCVIKMWLVIKTKNTLDKIFLLKLATLLFAEKYSAGQHISLFHFLWWFEDFRTNSTHVECLKKKCNL